MKLPRSAHVIAQLLMAAAVLLTGGCSDGGAFAKFSDSTKGVFDYLSGRTPIVAAKKMLNEHSADDRRVGINELVDRQFGQHPPYTTEYEHIAARDSDWLVRATAIRALNRARVKAATGIFIKSLDDTSDEVRLEACKALINLPDPKSAPGLIKLVNNPGENRDVRIAAADALRHYKTIEVARTLVNALGQREFAVAWQSRRSLMELTGKDLKYDEAAWLGLLTSNAKPFG
jgi:HEAT repeat protein